MINFYFIFPLFLALLSKFIFIKKIYVIDFYFIGLFFFYGIYTIFFLIFNEYRDFAYNSFAMVFLYLIYIYCLLVLIIKILSHTLNIKLMHLNKVYSLVSKSVQSKKNELNFLGVVLITTLICVSFLSNFSWIKIIHQEFQLEVSPFFMSLSKSLLMLFYSLVISTFFIKKKSYSYYIFFIFLLLLAINLGRREFLFFLIINLFLITFEYKNTIFEFVKFHFKKMFFLLLIFVIVLFGYAEVRYKVRSFYNPDSMQLNSFDSTTKRNANFVFDAYIHKYFDISNNYANGEYLSSSISGSIPKLLNSDKKTFHQENYVRDHFKLNYIGRSHKDYPLSIHMGAFIDFGFVVGGIITCLLLLLCCIPLFFRFDYFYRIYSYISISNYFFHTEKLYGNFISFYIIFIMGFAIYFFSKLIYSVFNETKR